jgi:hypothetical protein
MIRAFDLIIRAVFIRLKLFTLPMALGSPLVPSSPFRVLVQMQAQAHAQAQPQAQALALALALALAQASAAPPRTHQAVCGWNDEEMP